MLSDPLQLRTCSFTKNKNISLFLPLLRSTTLGCKFFKEESGVEHFVNQSPAIKHPIRGINQEYIFGQKDSTSCYCLNHPRAPLNCSVLNEIWAIAVDWRIAAGDCLKSCYTWGSVVKVPRRCRFETMRSKKRHNKNNKTKYFLWGLIGLEVYKKNNSRDEKNVL